MPAKTELGKEIELEMEKDGSPHYSNERIKELAPKIKDAKLGLSFGMTDVWRNFKHAFGDNYDEVKKVVLDPLDDAKKGYVAEQKNYTDSLYDNVVKKLDIKKDTKESQAVQWFGEKKKADGVRESIDTNTGKKIKVVKEIDYTLKDLQKDFPNKWKDIVEAV